MTKIEIACIAFTVVETIASYFYWRHMTKVVKDCKATQDYYLKELENFAGWRNTF